MSAAAAPQGFRLQAPIGLVSAFAPLNSTLIAVGLPAIRRDLGIGSGALTLLVSSYLIAVAVCQPVGGRLGDAFGHLRIVKAGLAVLVFFSFASALAWNFEVLVAMRALQGVSAALISPNAIAYLRKNTPPERLGAVLGASGAAIAGAAALGPIFGGLLLFAGDWRLLLIANVPLALLAAALVFTLPADKGAGRAVLKLDPVSLFALLAGFTGITLFGNALRLRIPALTGVAVLLFAGGLAVYAIRYARTRSGVVDLRLFTRRNYSVPAAGNALNNCVMYTTLIAMPIYLGDLQGMSDFASAMALFVLGATMVVIGPFAGRLSDRVGPRPLMSIGAVIMLLASVALIGATNDAPFPLLLVPLLMIGASLGLISGPQQAVSLRALAPSEAGSGSGTYQMMRYVGSVAGTALLAGIVGKQATYGEFQLLFLVLSGVAAINLATAFLIRPGTEIPHPGPLLLPGEGREREFRAG